MTKSKTMLFAVFMLLSMPDMWSGKPSDLQHRDLSRVEFGNVDDVPNIYELRDGHFLARYRRDGKRLLGVYSINGARRLETDTLNTFGNYPKFDNGALMVKSNKSKINWNYYPLSILYTTGEVKSLPTEWKDATNFVDGVATVMDANTKKVHYINTQGQKVFPHLDWTNKHNNMLPETRPLVDNRRAYRNDEGLWGFIDGDGAIVIPAKYPLVRDFSDGHAGVVVKMDDGSYKRGFINTMGEFTCQPIFRGNKNHWDPDLGDVQCGRILYHDDDVWKYLDTQGHLLKSFGGQYGIFCRPFYDNLAMVYMADEANDNKTTMYIINTDMKTVTQYVDRYGERLVDYVKPKFARCGMSWYGLNSGNTRIIRPDGSFAIGPDKEWGEEGWEPWNDVFELPQPEGLIFARRQIDDEDYYGFVFPSGQFRVLFDRPVAWAGQATW